jgi:tetratricopeptide (TPR) repeat protein
MAVRLIGHAGFGGKLGSRLSIPGGHCETLAQTSGPTPERTGGLDGRSLAARHAQWYLGQAKTGRGELSGAATEEWLERLDADLENLRSAISWARDHDEHLEVELAGATWYFLSLRGFFREALSYLRHALETAESASLDPDELLKGASKVAISLGDLAAAERWSEQRLELGRARGDQAVIARSLIGLGNRATRQRTCTDALPRCG